MKSRHARRSICTSATGAMSIQPPCPKTRPRSSTRCRAKSAEVACMFERPHHRDVALVLQALEPAALSQRHCWFGGGTAMALKYGEYRESLDIDFLVADRDGYRELRQVLGGVAGLAPLVRPGLPVEL